MITRFPLTFAAMALTAVCGLVSPTANAEGDAARGEAIAYTCLGCHGIEGYRNAYPSYRVPKLGGQRAAYLVLALQGYRSGTRTHATMSAQASSLSDQDIEDVAAYLASVSNETVAAGGSTAASPPEAAAVCAACHGQNGIGMSPGWPTLAGQHEDYLLHALEQYRSGARGDAVMAQFASQLSEQDVAALAQYFSGLDGLETTGK